MTIDNQEIRRTLQNLLPGSRYATRVRAFNELGQYSDWSEALEFVADSASGSSYTLVAPPAPTIQPQINALTVIMSYPGTNDGIVQYILEMSTDNVSFSQIATSPIGIYIHQVSPGTTYYYRFKVKDVYGSISPVSPSNSGQAASAVSHKPYATVVVAAADSIAEGKENADFVCDGVDDHITINAAAAFANTTFHGVGKVVLLEGRYHIAGEINTIGDVQGQGRDSTELILSADLITGAGYVQMLTCNSVSDLKITSDYIPDGSRRYKVGGDGLVFAQKYCTNVSIGDVYEDNLLLNLGNEAYASNCYFNGGQIGIYDGGNNSISNCIFIGQTEDAIHSGSTGNSILGCSFDSTRVRLYNDGTVMGNVFNNTLLKLDGSAIVSNNFFYDGSSFNIAIESIDESTIFGNYFDGCGIEDNSFALISNNIFNVSGEVRAIKITVPFVNGDGSFVNNTVIGTAFSGTGHLPPIRIDNSVTSYLVEGNRIKVHASTGAFSDAGITTNYGAGNYINKVWILPAGLAYDKNYVHDQPSTATTWTINHNLAKRASIVTIDSTSRIIVGDVTYISDNQITVTFNTAVSGKAYCN